MYILAVDTTNADFIVRIVMEDDQGRWYTKEWDVESPAFHRAFSPVEVEKIFRLAYEDLMRQGI